LFVLASVFVLSHAQDTKIAFGFANLVGSYGFGDADSSILLHCQNHRGEQVHLPKSNPDTVLGVLGQDPIYSQTLVRWIKLAGLVQQFNANPITLFVPAPYVFSRVSANYIKKYELPENLGLLRKLLQFWISPSYSPANKLDDGMRLGTVFGQPLNVVLNGTGAYVNGLPLTQVDVTATNGIIHTVGGWFEPKDIATLLAENGNFKSLLSAATSVGLTLSANREYTLFAPTDAAFSKLPTDALKALLSDPRMLNATLQYHLLNSKVLSTAVTNGLSAPTMNGGQTLSFALKDYIYVNKQRVSQTDVIAFNGVIHVVEGVLTLKDLVAVADDLGYHTFTSAVAAAGLTQTLSTPASRTVFIPSDAAFADLPAGVLAALSQASGKADLIKVLTNHVLNQNVYSDQLYNGQTLQTVLGSSLMINTNISGVTVNGALITKSDEVTSSGVVHFVSKVLVPFTVTQLLAQSGQFSTLLNLLGSINFQGLPNGGFYTLFAPTDAAFAKLGAVATRLANNKAALSTVLTYHVVAGSVCSSQFTNGLQLTTAQGSNVTITLSRGVAPKVNQANILFLDHLGSDGIVHFIDDVLLPPNFPLP
jgi:uncharacterized surface protein with fasciclin (FAS1) repeats